MMVSSGRYYVLDTLLSQQLFWALFQFWQLLPMEYGTLWWPELELSQIFWMILMTMGDKIYFVKCKK